MSPLHQYIASYFGLADPTNIQTIVDGFSQPKLKKGDFLLKEGKRCESLCFVQSGLLRVFCCTEDREITQWISSKGYFATDLASFAFDSPARFSIQALADTELFVLSKAAYANMGEKIASWHQLEKMFLMRCFVMLEDRVLSHLSMSAEERYHHFFENNRELFTQVPLQYIASMLGMSAETFSRIRKKQMH